MRLIKLLNNSLPVMLCWLVIAGVSAAPTQTLSSIEMVTDMYEAGNYNEVIALLTDAISLEPDNAAYHHLLAKSYGREAQRVNWFKAMDYARKTCAHLETAVQLENNNLDYLDDLLDYYREAPGFLGGDKYKAREIESRIRQVRQVSSNAIP